VDVVRTKHARASERVCYWRKTQVNDRYAIGPLNVERIAPHQTPLSLLSTEPWSKCTDRGRDTAGEMELDECGRNT
jgi:hypothetical protein